MTHTARKIASLTPPHTYAGVPFPVPNVMGIDQWYGIPDNPRQRDHHHRLKVALLTHLSAPTIDHVCVSAAELPDGSLVKLDGHTRTEAWKSGALKAPDHVVVMLYRARDIDEVKELYTHFDSEHSVEKSHEKLSGAARETGIAFTSSFMLSRRYSSALMYAEGFTSKAGYCPYQAFNRFHDALAALDAINPNKTRFDTGITTAALLTMYRPGVRAQAIEFWTKFNQESSALVDGELDCPSALSWVRCEIKLGNHGSLGGGRSMAFAVAARALCLFECYLMNPKDVFRVTKSTGLVRGVGTLPIYEYRNKFVR